MAMQQASEYQLVADPVRARIWQLHLRGIPKTRIAADVGLHRATVARVIAAHYADIASERKESAARKLDGAIQRMRLVQEQAWADHDEDDRREREVLSLALSGAAAASAASDTSDASDGANVRIAKTAKSSGKQGKDASVAPVRYQSQRSQYLRVILDAEKEIARLEGLYDGQFDIEGAIGFVAVKRAENANSRSSSQLDLASRQSGQIVTSVSNTGVLDAPSGAEMNTAP